MSFKDLPEAGKPAQPNQPHTGKPVPPPPAPHSKDADGNKSAPAQQPSAKKS